MTPLSESKSGVNITDPEHDVKLLYCFPLQHNQLFGCVVWGIQYFLLIELSLVTFVARNKVGVVPLVLP